MAPLWWEPGTRMVVAKLLTSLAALSLNCTCAVCAVSSHDGGEAGKGLGLTGQEISLVGAGDGTLLFRLWLCCWGRLQLSSVVPPNLHESGLGEKQIVCVFLLSGLPPPHPRPERQEGLPGTEGSTRDCGTSLVPSDLSFVLRHDPLSTPGRQGGPGPLWPSPRGCPVLLFWCDFSNLSFGKREAGCLKDCPQ